MQNMLNRRIKYICQLKDLQNRIMKDWERPSSDILDFINKSNYILTIDDGLLEEYESICKRYYNRDLCKDVFEKVLLKLNRFIKDCIYKIEDKDIDLKVIIFAHETPNDLIIELLEMMENDEYITEKIGWSFEYDHRSGLYKLCLCVKEV